MSDDRRGALELILQQKLAPFEQKVESLARDVHEANERLQRIEEKQEQILRLIQKQPPE